MPKVKYNPEPIPTKCPCCGYITVASICPDCDSEVDVEYEHNPPQDYNYDDFDHE